MFSANEQFTSTAKTNLEAQLATASAFTNKAFDNMAQLVALNLGAARASLEHSAVAAQKLLSAKDAKEFFELSAAQAQPNAEKVLAYGRSLAGFASAAQSEITQAAKAQITTTTKKIANLVDDAANYAPAGSENAMAGREAAGGGAGAGEE